MENRYLIHKLFSWRIWFSISGIHTERRWCSPPQEINMEAVLVLLMRRN